MSNLFASQSQPSGSGYSQARQKDSTVFSCTIDFILFPRAGQAPNADGFTIAKAIHSETHETITLKGKFGPVSIGETIEIAQSSWRDDGKFGEFLQVWSRSHKDPITREAIIRYLEHLPSVGPVLANAIIDTLGTDCLNLIDDKPELLLTVRTSGGHHIHARQLDEVHAQWDSLRADRKNMLLLSSLGLSDSDAKKISNHFGENCADVIRKNPYDIMIVDGIKFKRADGVAQQMGISSTDPRRLEAGMEYLLDVAEREGHVCLSRHDMLRRGPKLLYRGFDTPTTEMIEAAINKMIEQARLWSEVQDNGVELIYTTEMFIIETRLYDLLEAMLHEDEDSPDDTIFSYEFDVPENSILTKEQWAAIVYARYRKLSLITGNPGTGKTTALNELLNDLDSKGQSYICLAPTGRAAKRMQESTGRKAQTLHRRLGFGGLESPTTMKGSSLSPDAIPFDEDVVVVDETSMLDMRMAERLLSHVTEDRTRVVFVGDPDQLPAIGAGSVLLDLIESGRVTNTRLTRIHRQGADSLLVENAHRIRQGIEPYYTKEEAEAATGKAYVDDFRFIEVTNDMEAVDVTIKATQELADELRIPSEEVVVATAMRIGGTGTNILHKHLQAKYNPSEPNFREGDQPLRVGDRVMNTVNRYGKFNKDTGERDPDIMNGDVGKVVSYNPAVKTATVDFVDGTLTYTKEEMGALIGAYASTVHKLQGSEAPAIIVPYMSKDDPMTGVSRMFNRNHIYTAITRGKRMAVIVGKKSIIAQAVARDGSRRNSTLDLKVGAIPRRVKKRHEQIMKGLPSVQALLGSYGVEMAGGHINTPGSQTDN